MARAFLATFKSGDYSSVVPSVVLRRKLPWGVASKLMRLSEPKYGWPSSAIPGPDDLYFFAFHRADGAANASFINQHVAEHGMNSALRLTHGFAIGSC
jgi:hypothetical protein